MTFLKSINCIVCISCKRPLEYPTEGDDRYYCPECGELVVEQFGKNITINGDYFTETILNLKKGETLKINGSFGFDAVYISGTLDLTKK